VAARSTTFVGFAGLGSEFFKAGPIEDADLGAVHGDQPIRFQGA